MRQDTQASRRDVIRIAGAAGLSIGAMAGSPLSAAGKAASRGNDIEVLQVALALEHEGIAAYRIAAGSGLLSAGVIQVATVFLGHHQGHRDALAKLVTTAGGKPVEPKSDAEYIQALNIGALKSEADVIKFAAGLEQGATNAYVGQIAALRDPKLAHLFGQLGTDEAVHWALLNNAAGGSVAKAAFLFG